MKVCKAKTRSGAPCAAKPLRGESYCFTHSPNNAQARARAHRKGGLQSRTPHAGQLDTLPAQVRTLEDASRILTYTLQEIAIMPNSLQRSRILIALFDAFVRSLEVGEIENRLAALEGMKQ